jgi:hypothetical protein
MLCLECQDYVFELQILCRCGAVPMREAGVQEDAINSCAGRTQDDSSSGSAMPEAPSPGMRIQDVRIRGRRLCRRRKRHDLSTSQRENNHEPKRKSAVRYLWSAVRVSGDSDSPQIGFVL